MPYKTNDDLPAGVKNNLPAEAKTTWRKIYNSAYATYDGDEAKSNATAWAGLKNAGWGKDDQGKWVKVEKSSTLIEGRILKKEAKQRFTLGLVYSPLEVDTQGEFTTADEIEKACWEFNRALQGKAQVNKIAMELLEAVVKALQEGKEFTLDLTELLDDVEKAGGMGLGFMHEQWDQGLGDIVESYTTPMDFDLTTPAGVQKVKKGAWLMGIVWSPDYFAKVESGEMTGLSMGGTAVKIPVEGVN